jgi:hypothetical protein
VQHGSAAEQIVYEEDPLLVTFHWLARVFEHSAETQSFKTIFAAGLLLPTPMNEEG